MKLFFFSLLAALSLLISAEPVFAQTNTSACDTLKQQFQNAGGSDVVNKLPQYCSTSTIYTKITTVLYSLIAIVAVIVIIYGGYLYMTARDNAAQAAKARSVLTWAIIGVIVVVLAAVIVNVVVKLVVENRLS